MITGYEIWDGTSSVADENKLKVCWNDPSDIVWSENPYCWEDVFLVEKILGGSSGNFNEFIPTFHKLKPEEKEKFITLVCKVEGYNQSKQTKKKTTSKNITAKQIQFTINEVLKNINVEILKS